MDFYKIKISNSPNWQRFHATTLGISVSSPNWQEEKFEAILNFAARNFQTIRLDVTDALYRHNHMAEGKKPEEALALANAEGALWLTRHQDIINACPIKPQVVRWAEWYSRPDYKDVLAGFQRAHEIDAGFREAIDRDANKFYQRKMIVPSLMELEHARNYLIEEVAVMTLQARELPSLKLYPGSELSCLKIVRNGKVPSAPKGLEREQFARVKFETNYSLSPTYDQRSSSNGGENKNYSAVGPLTHHM
jgi:tRNA-dependent cyclodipeptide synthase